MYLKQRSVRPAEKPMHSISGQTKIPKSIEFIIRKGIPNAEKLKSYQTAAFLCLKVVKYDKSYYQKSYEYTKQLERTYPEMAKEMYEQIIKCMEESFDFVDAADIYIKIRAKLLRKVGGR